MAPKKLEDATLEDLEKIFRKHGHKPSIAKRLAGMIEDVRWTERGDPVTAGEAIQFLLRFLDQEYVSPLAGEIYAEVVKQLLRGVPVVLHTMTGEPPYPLQRLIGFLGQHPPLEKVRGKIREFLAGVLHSRLVPGRAGDGFFTMDEPAVEALSCESLTRALLRYQMYDELEKLVENGIYDAIPALFEAVVEQTVQSGLPPDKARLALDHLMVETDAITKRFFCRLDDHRALRLLLMLEEEYRKEHGKPYELPDDDGERRRSVA